MSELYNTWKGIVRGVPISSSPMIGMVYKGVDKFFGKEMIGVLIEMYQDNDEGVLRLGCGKVVSVDLTSLKVIAA